jgi:hypothetical protein
VDEGFSGYVRGEWAALVSTARGLCPGVGLEESRELVLSALTRVGVRWRAVADKGHPDADVRRELARVCAKRSEALERRPEIQVMEVGLARAPRVEPADRPAEPAQEVGADEALEVLRGRIARGRQRRMVGASAAGMTVVVVVVAASLALTGSGGAPHHGHKRLNTTTVRQLRAFPNPPLDFANGITAGGGYIWTIENQSTKPGSISYVFRRDPVTGRILSRYRVPEQDDHITFGLGRVWVWHDNDDFATTAIATIGETGDIDIEKSTPPIAIQSVAFTADAAWFTEPAVSSLLKLRAGILGAAVTSTITGPRFVVPVGASAVLVSGPSAAAHVLPGGHRIDLGGRSAPTLVSSAPQYGFWVAHGRRVSYYPTVSMRPSLTLTLPLRVGAVIGDPRHGVYVALRTDKPPVNNPYLVYYSPAQLASGDLAPTESLHGLLAAEGIVANPAGGVVFVTNDGTVDTWRPTGSTAAVAQTATVPQMVATGATSLG